jgi:hypothetical protein
MHNAIRCFVAHARCVQLDGNASFPLKVHAIQKLLLHVTLGNCVGLDEQLICEGRLSMVNVSNDGKIPNVLDRHLYE